MAAERGRWPLGKQVAKLLRQCASLAVIRPRCTQSQTLAVVTGKIAKKYEAKGGDYENQPGSRNKAKKGAPEHKGEAGKLTAATHSSSVSILHCVSTVCIDVLQIRKRTPRLRHLRERRPTSQQRRRQMTSLRCVLLFSSWRQLNAHNADCTPIFAGGSRGEAC